MKIPWSVWRVRACTLPLARLMYTCIPPAAQTRVMTDPIFRQKMSVWETSKQSARVGMVVIQKEGLPALMKGSLTFSLKRVADWGTRFYFAVLSEDLFFRQGDASHVLTNQEKLAASLIGGTLSAFLTLPLDVMVAQIQQASKAGEKVSVLETFQSEFRQGGWERVAGFATKGFLARTLHVALTTGEARVEKRTRNGVTQHSLHFPAWMLSSPVVTFPFNPPTRPYILKCPSPFTFFYLDSLNEDLDVRGI